MHGGLTRAGLMKLEREIDALLKERDAKSPELEKPLKKLINTYSYEVEYYNTLHRTTPYENKYGTSTPLKYRMGLSIANVLANGKPAEMSTTISAFMDSCEAILRGTASRGDAARVMMHDPNPAQLHASVQNALSKMSMFSSSQPSPMSLSITSSRPAKLRQV